MLSKTDPYKNALWFECGRCGLPSPQILSRRIARVIGPEKNLGICNHCGLPVATDEDGNAIWANREK